MATPQFAVYKNTNTSTLTDNGTVRDLMTDDGSLGYIPSNLKRESKVNKLGQTVYNRVLLLIYNGEIDKKTKKPLSISMSCSEAVSRDLRAGNLSLSELADYNIVEDENGINFISSPGQGVVVIHASKLKTNAVSTKATNHQDLIVL